MGLAIVFLYAGFDSLANPQDWLGFVPDVPADIVSSTVLLKILAFYELALALWLLSGAYLHIAGLVCAATFGGIILTNLPLLDITFRDIGLLFAALAMTVLAWKKQHP